MSGVRAIATFSRHELEVDNSALRLALSRLQQDFDALHNRSEQAILDTARCASLTRAFEAVQHCIKSRDMTSAANVVDFVLEDWA